MYNNNNVLITKRLLYTKTTIKIIIVIVYNDVLTVRKSIRNNNYLVKYI